MVREKIKIVGIDCPTCVYSIQSRLRRLRGFRRIEIDPSSGDAFVEYDDEECRLRDIYRAVRDAGYDILKEKTIFTIRELSEDEVGLIESRILRIPGVLECHASSVTKLVSITYNPLTTNPDEVLTEIKNLGLSIVSLTEESLGKEPQEKFLLYRRLTTFLIGFFAVTHAMLSMYYETLPPHENEILLALLAVIAVSTGYDIIVRGVKSLTRLSPTMDSLITLSVLTTLTAGIAGILGLLEWREGLHNTSFFEASAGVIGFMSLGKYLEERLRKKSLKSLEDLTKTLYGKARVIENGVVKEKNVADITVGEVVEVKAGEIVPVDGVVTDGWGYVDESSFTGEPVPRLKKAESRDPVLAGSILTSGYLRIRVTRTSKNTTLYQIIETVREAQFHKPEIMRIADKIVGLLTWGVIAVAALTLTYWWLVAGEAALALTFSAAVLAIACPCALGIAVPMVISIAVLRATRNGILVRRGDVFERASEVRLVLFDKTGTLTAGKPALKKTYLINNVNEDLVLKHACSIESRSEHPISKAILNYCVERGINVEEPTEYVHMPGMGVAGTVNGVMVAVGNLELMRRSGANYSEEITKLIEEIGGRGSIAVLVSVGGEISAVLEIGDSLKPEAEEVIKELKTRGLKVGLVSGDSEASVRYYAKTLNLDLAYSELKPDEKAELVKKIQNEGTKVMFVGDGVNDAPAITSSSLGVAVGSGAEISRESGDVILTKNKLTDLIKLLNLSKITKKKSIENIAWAFIYNAALIPVAAGLLYTTHGIIIKPEMAALAMILSDITVILNAATLLTKKL